MQIVKLLIEHCTLSDEISLLDMLQEVDSDGNCALHLCADCGHFSLAELIIENCINLSKLS